MLRRLLPQDPRGYPRPPFEEGKLEMQPERGDIVVFPSWLGHQTTPTRGSEPRVAIAFNLNMQIPTRPHQEDAWAFTAHLNSRNRIIDIA